MPHFQIKKFFGVLLFWGSTFFLFAGALSGYTDIKQFSTEFFDIIYPPESEQTAFLLGKHCDKLYAEICTELGAETDLHLPIVITPGQDSLNAYFTPIPYNRIVVYDTAVTASNTVSLTVFEETLLSVLYHELVHAVSLNMKRGFVKFLGQMWGDYLNPAMLQPTSLFTEGVAVALESHKGEGRLNDGFATQELLQSKIEGKFPAWRNVSGARDVFPGGTMPYIFGGAFTRWLRDTYGKEKYSQFLYEWNSFHFFKLSAGIFKKVYGVSLNAAWNEFQNSVIIPENIFYPGEENSPYNYHELYTKKGLYSSLTASAKGLAWFNEYNSTVYLASHKDSGENSEKKESIASDGVLPKDSAEKKLTERIKISSVTTLPGLNRITFDATGEWLTLSRIKYNNQSSVSEVYVYNTNSKKLIKLPSVHLREGTVLKLSNGNLYAVAVYTESQNSLIKFYKITISDKGNISLEEENELTYILPQGVTAFSLTDTGKNCLAYTTGGKQNNITLLDPLTKEKKDFLFSPENFSENFSEFGQNCSIRNLSLVPKSAGALLETECEIMMFFSWATSKTMPRLGVIGIENWTEATQAQVYFADTDVSGGVYSPVLSPLRENTDTVRIDYIGSFYDHRRLMTVNFDALSFMKFHIGASKAEDFFKDFGENDVEENFEEDSSLGINTLEPVLEKRISGYNHFKYLYKGVFVPVPVVTRYDFLFNPGAVPLLGATWGTTDPSESVIFVTSGGYDFFTHSGGFLISLQGKYGFRDYAGEIDARFDSSVFFDQEGFQHTSIVGNLKFNLPFGRISSIEQNNILRWFYGKSPFGLTDTLWYQNILGYTNVQKRGSGFYNVGGVATGIFLDTIAMESGKDFYGNLGVFLTGYIPGYVPIIFDIRLIPNFGSLLDISGKISLFTWEVQEGIPFIPLYINRISFSVKYTGSFLRSNDSWDIFRLDTVLTELPNLKYDGVLSLQTEIMMSPNTGLITNAKMSLVGSLNFKLAGEYKTGDNLTWNIGFKLH